MDPNEVLRTARVALSGYLARQEDEGTVEGDALASAFEMLDAHLSKGGVMPDAWSRSELKLPTLSVRDEQSEE